MEWQPIETAPDSEDILVCVTHNVFGEDKYVWETVQWVDFFIPGKGWAHYPYMVWVPFPPTKWMRLPQPPIADGTPFAPEPPK